MQWRGERSGRGRPAGKKVVKVVEREQRKNGKGGDLSRGERERTERASERRRAGKKMGGWKESKLCENVSVMQKKGGMEFAHKVAAKAQAQLSGSLGSL